MQGEDKIEDWEIWGDPREIERRKAERARAAIPPDQRKHQVSFCVLLRFNSGTRAVGLPQDQISCQQTMTRQ